MKIADDTPELSNQATPNPDLIADDSSELNDTDLESVAGGTTWRLPEEPTSPWDEEVDL